MTQKPTEPNDYDLLGPEHLSVKAFVWHLSRDDRHLDYGLTQFTQALEKGLDVYDLSDHRYLTEPEIKALIAQCLGADGRHTKDFNQQFDIDYPGDGSNYSHQVLMQNTGESNQDFEKRLSIELAKNDGAWIDYLPQDAQSYRIRCQEYYCDQYVIDLCRWLEQTCYKKDSSEQSIWQSHLAKLNRLMSEKYGAGVLRFFEDHLQSELKASQKRGDIQGYRVAEILLDALRKLAESSQWGGPVLRFLDEIALSKTGAKPVSNSVKAERDCERWLCDLMQAPQPVGRTKESYQHEANGRFVKLSERGFFRAWDKAIGKSQYGAAWSKAGRKSER